MKPPAEQLLELLNFYGITFVRLCTDDARELAKTVAALVSAVLGCRISFVALKGSNEEVRVLAAVGLPVGMVPAWPADDPFVRALWERVEHAAILRASDLGPIPAEAACARRLGEPWIVAPIRDSSAGDERRIGLVVGSDLRRTFEPELALTGLDILSSYAASALASCRALAELGAANRALTQQVVERVRVEQMVRQLNLDLEKKVLQRTSELEVANRELEAFSYSVSHDLRAPLRSIDGFASALLEDSSRELAADTTDDLLRIRAAAQRMEQLIDDLLQLSNVTRTEVHKQPVDLAMLVRESADGLRRSEPSRDVELVVASRATAQGDAGLLRVVIENLIRNAWKFTRNRTRARIEFGVEARGGASAYFVRDNGAGFDPAAAGRLFHPFHRLHSARQFEGTGVGLSVVQRIVHRHGGQVWAEAAPGRGATFWFTLERRDAAVEPPTSPSPPLVGHG